MAITHSIYLVSDIPKAKAFLEEIFGYTVTADETTVTGDRFFTMAEPNTPSVQLQLIECSELPDIVALKQKSGVVDFIFETNDIATLMEKVNIQGLRIVRKPTKAAYGITAIFEDPFGNLWDLIQRH